MSGVTQIYKRNELRGVAKTDGNIIVGDGSDWVAESGATARTSLGVAIGSDVQAHDTQLDDIAGLTPTDGNIIVGNGANFITESGATARTSLGAAKSGSNSDITELTGITTGTWTPGMSANGSMTVSGITVWEGNYVRIGKVYLFEVMVTFTIGGTPNTLIFITAPATPQGHDANVTYICAADDGDGTEIADCRWRNGGTTFVVFPPNSAVWTTGASARIGINGMMLAA